MSVFIKNDTLVNQTWRGLRFLPGEYRELNRRESFNMSTNRKALAAISVGDAIVATADDGTADISNVLEGLAVLESSTSQMLVALTFTANDTRDEFMELGSTVKSNDSPYIVSFPCTLKSLAFSTESVTFDIHIDIMKNEVIEFTWPLVNVRKAVKTIGFGNISFLPGDTLCLFAGQNGVEAEDVVVTVLLGVSSMDVNEFESVGL